MAKTIMVDLTPDPYGMIMAEQGAAGMNASAAFNELIDNSLDAGATRISILKTNDDQYVIADDGTQNFGTEDDLVAFMRSGASTSRLAVGKSGQYGIGGKLAIQYFGSRFVLIARRNGVLRGLEMDREDIKRTKSWKQRVKVLGPSVLNKMWSQFSIDKKKDGVVIVIYQGSAKRVFRITDNAKILGKRFAPAIRSGASIILQTHKSKTATSCTYVEGQWFDDTCALQGIPKVLKFDKGARAEISIYKTHQSVNVFEWKGISIVARHRFVVLNDDREIIPADFGRYAICVQLIDGPTVSGRWELDTHKSSLRETERRDKLYSEISNIVTPILEQIKNERERIDMRALQNSLRAFWDIPKIADGESHIIVEDESGDPVIVSNGERGDGPGPCQSGNGKNIKNTLEAENGSHKLGSGKAGPPDFEFRDLGGLTWKIRETNPRLGRYTVFLDEKTFLEFNREPGALFFAMMMAVAEESRRNEKVRRYVQHNVKRRIYELPEQWEDPDFLSVVLYETVKLGGIPVSRR